MFGRGKHYSCSRLWGIGPHAVCRTGARVYLSPIFRQAHGRSSRLPGRLRRALEWWLRYLEAAPCRLIATAPRARVAALRGGIFNRGLRAGAAASFALHRCHRRRGDGLGGHDTMGPGVGRCAGPAVPASLGFAQKDPGARSGQFYCIAQPSEPRQGGHMGARCGAGRTASSDAGH